MWVSPKTIKNVAPQWTIVPVVASGTADDPRPTGLGLAAPVLWIFPVLALCRREVPSLKGGEGRQGWALCSRGLILGTTKACGSGDPLYWGFKKLGVRACACQCLPLFDCVFWCLPVPACTHANGPVLAVSLLPHGRCHRFKSIFQRAGRALDLLVSEIFKVRTPCISLSWWEQGQLLSLCAHVCLRQYVAQTVLKLSILLPYLPQCWACGYAQPQPPRVRSW